jgi:hypothetical protein
MYSIGGTMTGWHEKDIILFCSFLQRKPNHLYSLSQPWSGMTLHSAWSGIWLCALLYFRDRLWSQVIKVYNAAQMNVILHQGRCSILSPFILAVICSSWSGHHCGSHTAYSRFMRCNIYQIRQVYSVSAIMTTKKVHFVNHEYTPVLLETSKYLPFPVSLSIHHECRNRRIYLQSSTRCKWEIGDHDYWRLRNMSWYQVT